MSMDDMTSFKMKTCFSAGATEWAVFSSANHIPPGQATCVLYLGHVTSSLQQVDENFLSSRTKHGNRATSQRSFKLKQNYFKSISPILQIVKWNTWYSTIGHNNLEERHTQISDMTSRPLLKQKALNNLTWFNKLPSFVFAKLLLIKGDSGRESVLSIFRQFVILSLWDALVLTLTDKP